MSMFAEAEKISVTQSRQISEQAETETTWRDFLYFW